MHHSTILVATDFSEGYTTVLQKAIDLAFQKQAKLHIVHVVKTTFFKIKNLDYIKEHCWNNLLCHYPNISKEQFHCVEGNLDKVISIVAQTIHAEMIIIGDNRDKHPIEAIFLASDTKAIIKESRIPVLVVKNYQPSETYKTVLIPTDLSDNSLKMVQNIVKLFPEAYLILLHLYSVPFEFRLNMYGFNDDEITNFQEESRNNAEAELKNFMRQLNVPDQKMIPVVRKDFLSSEHFESNHKDLKADLIAIHTTGYISFFAFDLLEKTQNDVLIFNVVESA
ncbi:universal stress protein [Sulfurospirillum cavolei]|uniref:universal stress protein n=1 Tax=Sulfurospirillum cavolei TaxID=366522 RepID=UPI000764BF71|nr:universal stress protein [Sulfurospirillum cavolei]